MATDGSTSLSFDPWDSLAAAATTVYISSEGLSEKCECVSCHNLRDRG